MAKRRLGKMVVVKNIDRVHATCAHLGLLLERGDLRLQDGDDPAHGLSGGAGGERERRQRGRGGLLLLLGAGRAGGVRGFRRRGALQRVSGGGGRHLSRRGRRGARCDRADDDERSAGTRRAPDRRTAARDTTGPGPGGAAVDAGWPTLPTI